MTTPSIKNSISRPPLRRGVLLIPLALALAWFALSPAARAFSPNPDGGYPYFNTVEGDNALFSSNDVPGGSGIGNTAIGYAALYNDTFDGNYNTATGYKALFSNTTGIENTASGYDALFFNTTGTDNTANGFQALFSNTTGHDNTANGLNALYSNTYGFYNTANGFEALFSNNAGFNNTANGVFALFSNTTGKNNTANGVTALYSNNAGVNNTANGFQALYYNTTGGNNTANGVSALDSNTTGSNNTASGLNALYSNTTGHDNTANGVNALYANTTINGVAGNFNTANGRNALYHNTTGGNNTAEGFQALQNNTGSNNIGLGSNAGNSLTTGSNNIDIGNVGVAAETTTIRIGASQTRTFIAGIRGKTTINVNAIPVLIDSAGQLGTTSSSRRFKKEIKPMDQTSEAILALKPVTFQYKSDPAGAGPQFGLIAEEVAQVNPDLVVRDADGSIYTVRYDAVNAMLLNEFLKEHRTVQELKSALAKQEATAAQQQKQIEALTTGLQKVSAQLELNKPAPRAVLNNR